MAQMAQVSRFFSDASATQPESICQLPPRLPAAPTFILDTDPERSAGKRPALPFETQGRLRDRRFNALACRGDTLR
jgi:hypothetical protein